jgi:hypothetical protein
MAKLLVLSSNPRQDLKLEREIKDLTFAIRRLKTFEVIAYGGVTPEELLDMLAQESPLIVHFCGHGAGERGLVLQDREQREQLVATKVLAEAFKIFSNEVNCVVLNACDSDFQAVAIVEHINYVIGMRQEILDHAAFLFSVSFYKGLASEKSIEQSHEMGRWAILNWIETKSQSTQSRQSRKFEYDGEVVQAAQPQLAEYMKPVLRKKGVNSPSSSVPEEPPLSALSAPPPGVVEFVQQEVDRKEYKDRAREAYDNFGQFSAQQATSLTKSECEQRQILLVKVKSFWIKGFLQPLLQDNPAMRLDLKYRPDAIADLTQGIEELSVELDASYEELRETRIYEEMGQGRTLLILGDPGAGKTIALLQLAQRLIERSEQNRSLPMPVVFNLSSWTKERKKLVDWLIDELREKYQVSTKSLSESWITNQQLILLLDGLDEVKEDHRNDCVRALNKFIGDYPQTEVAVCSRVKDYEALTERLQLSSALCLQSLSSEQVYQFLDSVGGSLAGLKTLLKNDAELEQLAQTPLILSFMSVAYQGWSAKDLISQLRSTPERHKHLFDTYIDRRLERGISSEYSKDKDKVLRWLSWLASRMEQENQTIFLIEKMQPTWLKNRSEITGYKLIKSLVYFLLSLPILLSISGVNVWLIGIVAPIIGLIFELFFTITPSISPLEKISWSWQRAKSRFVSEFFRGVCRGLIFGLIIGLIGGLVTGINALFFALFLGLLLGLSGGLMKGLGSGLVISEIVERTAPNQGIRASLRNSLFIVLIFGLIGGGTGGLTFGLQGLNAGLLYGGIACIQHFILRCMLYQKGRIPWDYEKFLDFVSERKLMKKVGGGYIFLHRMLLEYFARMNHN